MTTLFSVLYIVFGALAFIGSIFLLSYFSASTTDGLRLLVIPGIFIIIAFTLCSIFVFFEARDTDDTLICYRNELITDKTGDIIITVNDKIDCDNIRKLP